MALLAAVAAHFADGETVDADILSASRALSSLEGWMTASILTMRLTLEIVAFLAVQREIHAVGFLAFAHAERGRQLGDLSAASVPATARPMPMPAPMS